MFTSCRIFLPTTLLNFGIQNEQTPAPEKEKMGGNGNKSGKKGKEDGSP